MRMVIALVFVGCAAGDGALYVTPDVDMQALVESAAAEWTDIGCPVFIAVDGVRVSLVERDAWTFGDATGIYDGARIYIKAGMSDALAHAVTLHEIGHALGYGHSDEGIMRAHVSWPMLVPADCH